MPTDVTLETSIETANSAKSLRELGKGLKDLIALQSQVGAGTADFKKLQDAINKTEGKVGDLKDSFGTLRGSGIERVNSSLSLFREGLLNADTDKIKIGLQGIGAAMKAIPIFLLIEGAKLLYENWDKVTKLFSETKTESELLTESLARQAEELDNLNASANRVLTIRKAQGYSEVELLKIEIAAGEDRSKLLSDEIRRNEEFLYLKKNLTEEEKKNLTERIAAQNKAYEDNLTNTVAATFRLDKAIADEEKKRLDEQAKARKEAEELYQKNFARKRELTQREIDAEKKQLEDMLAFQSEIDKKRIEAEKKAQEAIASVKDDVFLLSIERGKREYAIEHDALKSSLDGRLQLLEESKLKELSLVDENSQAAFEIEKKYATLALQEKLKSSQQIIGLAQNVAGILNATSQLLSENENYRIQQDSYIKDAELENSKNRSQEQIDIEIQKSNKLLNNENLTEAEREKIKYDSETKQRQIDIQSKNAQISIQNEFDKKSLQVRRAQFEREKKIQLVTASINTAAAIVSALGTVTPYPLAIAAAAGAAIAGGIQIATIANKKFDDGGSAARSNVAPISNIDTRGGFANSGGGSAPSTNLNPSGNVTGAGNNNGQVKVVVLESDIREVTSKVSVLEDRATFG